MLATTQTKPAQARPLALLAAAFAALILGCLVLFPPFGAIGDPRLIFADLDWTGMRSISNLDFAVDFAIHAIGGFFMIWIVTATLFPRSLTRLSVALPLMLAASTAINGSLMWIYLPPHGSVHERVVDYVLYAMPAAIIAAVWRASRLKGGERGILVAAAMGTGAFVATTILTHTLVVASVAVQDRLAARTFHVISSQETVSDAAAACALHRLVCVSAEGDGTLTVLEASGAPPGIVANALEAIAKYGVHYREVDIRRNFDLRHHSSETETYFTLRHKGLTHTLSAMRYPASYRDFGPDRVVAVDAAVGVHMNVYTRVMVHVYVFTALMIWVVACGFALVGHRLMKSGRAKR